MERALMLRRRRCSDWRARFFADLMLAKVELRNAGLRVEKDANSAVDSPMRQSFTQSRSGRRGPAAAILPHPVCATYRTDWQTTRPTRSTPTVANGTQAKNGNE